MTAVMTRLALHINWDACDRTKLAGQLRWIGNGHHLGTLTFCNQIACDHGGAVHRSHLDDGSKAAKSPSVRGPI